MKRLVLIVIAIGVIGVVLLRRHSGNSAGAAVPPPAVPVTVTHPQYADLPIWLEAVGTVQSVNVVNVKVRVDGQLQRVVFTEGTNVRQGAVLAQIDPRPFKAQLELARANLAKDQAQVTNAKVNLDRFQKLATLGAAASQNVDTFRAQVGQLEAAMQGDRAMIDTAQLDLSFTTVRSPIDGRVGIRLVDPGSIVHASDPSGIVTVTQMDPIEVMFSLPQDQLPGVLAAQGALEVDAVTRSDGRVLAKGALEVIDNQIDPATGQVRIKALFNNERRTLWPGELVAARILLRTDLHVLVVPARAVQLGQNGSFVYVVAPNSMVAVRPVKVDASVDGFSAIASGLAATDSVVLDGQSRIAPGTSVAASGGAS
ncbi:MAG: efflux transporter periplasmic adaptor subunit [Myxococcales bacterium]|nr:efflux transporter periplasmic adaptor subunit [Myxococcales bacterium]